MSMNNCECCGNTYDKAFELTIGGTTHIFDSFQCAHCARQVGISDVSDRAPDHGAAPP